MPETHHHRQEPLARFHQEKREIIDALQKKVHPPPGRHAASNLFAAVDLVVSAHDSAELAKILEELRKTLGVYVVRRPPRRGSPAYMALVGQPTKDADEDRAISPPVTEDGLDTISFADWANARAALEGGSKFIIFGTSDRAIDRALSRLFQDTHSIG